MNMLFFEDQFKQNEISEDFLLSYMKKIKVDKAISSFYQLESINSTSEIYDVLKYGFKFMEIFFNSLNGKYDPYFNKSLIHFVKSEIGIPLYHSNIHCFGDCMWDSASLLFNSPFDYEIVDISDSSSKLKYAFDLFGSDVVVDLKELLDLEYDINEDYNLDHVMDMFYANSCPGYRDAFISNSSLNELTNEQINMLPGVLLGNDTLRGEFKVEVVLVEYDGADSFISNYKDDCSQIDSFLEALSKLVRYSCPRYINISKSKVVSNDDLFKLGYDYLSSGVKIAFIAFSDSYDEYEGERNIDCKMSELYRIWNAYMNVEGLLER